MAQKAQRIQSMRTRLGMEFYHSIGLEIFTIAFNSWIDTANLQRSRMNSSKVLVVTEQT